MRPALAGRAKSKQGVCLQETMADDPRPVDQDSAEAAALIVGVGTSAGGLATLKELLAGHVRGHGIGLVIVQHLDPTQESQLAHLLARDAPIPVEEATDGCRVDADYAYIMPSGKAMTIEDGVLRLHERRPGIRFPIDVFLDALAEDQQDHAVAVVLTGTGHDGAAGVKAIHEHGGLVIAQDPDEAEFPDMPEAARATGAVDITVHVKDIIARVADFERGARTTPPEEELPAVLDALQRRGPPDFGKYRPGTLLRRVQRRMNLRGISDIEEYVKILAEDDDEADQMKTEMLLGVTSFFRDPEAFKALDDHVIDGLFAHDGAPVRVWVAGCANGEEAYSIAMLLKAAHDRRNRSTQIQVFATDISDRAIATARKGVYTADDLAAVPDELRERFFTAEGTERFRVKRDLRETIAFAAHDLLSDPPLPAMDLVCCRNLLIYLKPAAQRDVLRSFQFALRPGGHLFLGASENAGRLDDAFQLVSKAGRIYRRTETPFVPRPAREQRSPPRPSEPPPVPDSEVAKEWLLEHHAPPAVAVDDQRRILTVTGDVSGFLGVQRGHGSLDVVELAHKEIRPRLRTMLHQAGQRRAPAHAAGVPTPDGSVDIRVEPVRDGLFIVTFHGHATPAPTSDRDEDDDAVVQELEDELRVTKQRLGETLASSEAANEELRASSEEISSMNEELRTTIEELEASKEELQSLNEELQDVNQRLTEETENAKALSDDLSNLFASSGIPVLFLDRDLRVRRRMPATDRLFGPGGPATPVEDIDWRFTDPDFTDDARRVLEELSPVTREIRTDEGHRYRRRLLPYRTQDDRIDGLVVVFDDVEALLRVEDELRASEAYVSAIVKTVPTPVLVLREGLRIKSANPAFLALFGFLPGDVQDRSLPALLGAPWDLPGLGGLLNGEGETLEDVVLEHQQHGTRFVFQLTARRLPAVDGESFVLAALQDITSLKEVERDLLSFTSRLHRRVEEQTSEALERASLLERVSYAIGHDLQEPIRSMDALLTVFGEEHRSGLSKDGQEMLLEVHRENERLTNLVRGLLDFSRAMQEDVHRVYPISVQAALADEDCTTRFSRLLDERGTRMEVEGDGVVLASMSAMGYILGNLVQNAILHNDAEDPLVRVQVRRTSGEVEVVVEDNGPGFPPDVVAGLERKGVATRGFGLSIADQMARFLGGSLRLGTSPQGGGAAKVRLPAAPDEDAGDESE